MNHYWIYYRKAYPMCKRSRFLYKSLFMLYILISWSLKDDLIANLGGKCGVPELSSIQSSIVFSPIKSYVVLIFIWKASPNFGRNRLTDLGHLIYKSTFSLLLDLCPFINLADTPVHRVAHWLMRFMFFCVVSSCDRVLLLHGVASTRLESRQINCVGRHQLLGDSKEIGDKTVQKI